MTNASPAPRDLAGGAGPANKARAGLIAKVLVSAALLFFLARKLDWPAMGQRLAGASVTPLALALVLLTVTVAIAGLRWRVLVRQAGAQLSLTQAVQLTFAGMFFGQVLPATIGGDVVRGVMAGRGGVPWEDVVVTIVLDRLAALLASVILIVCGLPILSAVATGEAESLTWIAVAAAGAVLAATAGLFIFRNLPAWLARKAWMARLWDLAGRLRSGLVSRGGFVAVVLSLLIHLSTVATVLLIGAGLGVEIEPKAAFAVVPLAILAAAIPISLNGWGVREGVMVSGLAFFSVQSGDALLISVFLGIGVVISVLPGSVTWLALR